MSDKNFFDRFNSEEEFRAYLQSDEYKQKIEQYVNSEEYKTEMKQIRKKLLLLKLFTVLKYFGSNALSIIAILISIASLVISVLAYLKM